MKQITQNENTEISKNTFKSHRILAARESSKYTFQSLVLAVKKSMLGMNNGVPFNAEH